ncbi:hypothetical protein NEPAR06_2039 [Nematocida parisii]|uniref:Meiotic nuclear division protein 1 n=1 Tax=Nematocida parisii (strain ERTm3) TaxID=935791 RepID=I3EDW7_NEMP3|nr:uncharacterized protein NEPG_00016 [Nematocida parisii ERTm1]EIJ87414.1 hypothetical protein NEQG_02295 [Nematocida parisii ERTm3]KAI5129596.1 hypothetical protein NEPAR08_1672 [Nematocida parisii]EIJ94494.1 hypothetical protein NEPG_00016 [Nematocida parisii ERTm1]KAI5129625.1 hypothetical protein NEPAR03_1755 [Nematocida parisii]KAI5142242.1 hypothetical protein NEPAR04_1488 [Nematocida parisii]|eukprot:XP_013057850.1 hypothetical protein NEPG_00016 [Nematocida parisii ERTm1]
MSRAKPLSMEEKTKRILDLLQTKDTVFNLKELEKLGQKEKGVVPQSMKEVIDILVSENKVKEKKVGITKYYWSFRSDIKLYKEVETRKLIKEMEGLNKAKDLLNEEISVMKQNRSTLPDREAKISQLNEMKKDLEESTKKVAILDENNPIRITRLKEELSVAKQDLSDWGDAFNIIQNHIKDKFNITQQDFVKSFGITASDMEKIEEI